MILFRPSLLPSAWFLVFQTNAKCIPSKQSYILEETTLLRGFLTSQLPGGSMMADGGLVHLASTTLEAKQISSKTTADGRHFYCIAEQILKIDSLVNPCQKEGSRRNLPLGFPVRRASLVYIRNGHLYHMNFAIFRPGPYCTLFTLTRAQVFWIADSVPNILSTAPSRIGRGVGFGGEQTNVNKNKPIGLVADHQSQADHVIWPTSFLGGSCDHDNLRTAIYVGSFGRATVF